MSAASGGTSPSDAFNLHSQDACQWQQQQETPTAVARPTALRGSPRDSFGRTACKELLDADVALRRLRSTRASCAATRPRSSTLWSTDTLIARSPSSRSPNPTQPTHSRASCSPCLAQPCLAQPLPRAALLLPALLLLLPHTLAATVHAFKQRLNRCRRPSSHPAGSSGHIGHTASRSGRIAHAPGSIGPDWPSGRLI